jgi:hypothetical protein
MPEAAKTLGALTQAQTTTLKRKYLVFEATVTTSDTITITGITTLDAGCALAKASDGSAVTYTKATNVLTVTTAGLTNEHIVGFAIGA